MVNIVNDKCTKPLARCLAFRFRCCRSFAAKSTQNKKTPKTTVPLVFMDTPKKNPYRTLARFFVPFDTICIDPPTMLLLLFALVLAKETISTYDRSTCRPCSSTKVSTPMLHQHYGRWTSMFMVVALSMLFVGFSHRDEDLLALLVLLVGSVVGIFCHDHESLESGCLTSQSSWLAVVVEKIRFQECQVLP